MKINKYFNEIRNVSGIDFVFDLESIQSVDWERGKKFKIFKIFSA